MLRNTSTPDRLVRLAVAGVAAIVALVIGAGSVIGILLLLVAAILVVTAASGFCPLYRLFGLSSNREARSSH